MAQKPKVAITWLGACGGCDMAVVDLDAGLLDVADKLDIVLWPVALDFKYKDVEALPDCSLALAIISGCVRNDEHLEIARLLRQKAGLVLALGACACFGGTPGLANFVGRQEILDFVYKDAPTVENPEGVVPQAESRVNGHTLTLPAFHEKVRAIKQVIEVDYFLPGCPPPPQLISQAINAVLAGDLPPKGSALAPRRALCDVCPRNRKKPARIEIHEIRQIHEVETDPDYCFLEEGILCMGPATRSGCGETCIRNNMPCRGCFGPVAGVEDAGTKHLSALASILRTEQYFDLAQLVENIPDPAGFFYRFTQPVSILGKAALKMHPLDKERP